MTDAISAHSKAGEATCHVVSSFLLGNMTCSLVPNMAVSLVYRANTRVLQTAQIKETIEVQPNHFIRG